MRLAIYGLSLELKYMKKKTVDFPLKYNCYRVIYLDAYYIDKQLYSYYIIKKLYFRKPKIITLTLPSLESRQWIIK